MTVGMKSARECLPRLWSYSASTLYSSQECLACSNVKDSHVAWVGMVFLPNGALTYCNQYLSSAIFLCFKDYLSMQQCNKYKQVSCCSCIMAEYFQANRTFLDIALIVSSRQRMLSTKFVMGVGGLRFRLFLIFSITKMSGPTSLALPGGGGGGCQISRNKAALGRPNTWMAPKHSHHPFPQKEYLVG